jgi:hypothetical protein
MSRLRNALSFANVMATIAVFLALGGVAVAAGKIGGGAIKDHSLTGRDIKKGSIPLSALKRIPEGKAGPAGPAGADGSALAYAHVNADGTLDTAKSKNIASTKQIPKNYYCVLPSVPVSNVLVGGDGGLVGRVYNASFEDHITSCPDGAASVEIVKAGGGSVSSDFYIVFN